MDGKFIRKAEIQNLTKYVEYVPNSVVIKSIVQKTTGKICVIAFDAGEELKTKIHVSITLFKLLKVTLKL